MKTTGYSKLLALASAALLLACNAEGGGNGEGDGAAPQPGADTAYRAEVDAWHARRLERLQREDGWLSLVGLHPLQAGENRIGTGAGNQIQLPGPHPARIGSIFLGTDTPRFVSAQDVFVTVDGAPVSEVALRTDADTQSGPTQLQCGSLRFYLIERGDRLYLRSKDSESEVRKDFHGIERFSVDPRWRIEAELERYEEAKEVAVPNVLGSPTMERVPGELVFTHEGTEYRVLPTLASGDRLFLVFGDASNGATTYGGGRFLYADPADEKGRVILDFNLAYNPPCAFTPYATCPLPTEENVLPFEVRAGEKSWGEKHP